MTRATGDVITAAIWNHVEGFHGVLARSTADSAITAGGEQVVPLADAEDFDTDGYHSLVTNTNRLTVPTGRAGYYLVQGCVGWAAAANSHGVFIRNNAGTCLDANKRLGNASIADGMNVSVITHLAAGAYVELTAQTSVNQNLDASEVPTWFGMFLLNQDEIA